MRQQPIARIELPLHAVGLGQVGVKGKSPGSQGHGTADQLDGFLVVTLLMMQNAE